MEKKNIIITSGGTSEAIDNVRKITNSSSGKLGMIIANELLKEDNINTLYYLCSKTAFKPIHEKVKITEITGTMDLKEKVEDLLTNNRIDCFIHSMAVSDYMVDYVSTASLLAQAIEENKDNNLITTIKENKNTIQANKISSYEDNLLIMLKPTPKIISLIKMISPKTYLVGFKLLDQVSEEELIEVATNLKNKNHCDLVVANDLNTIRMGNHKAFIIGENKHEVASGKEEIARKLVKRIHTDGIL